MKVNIGENVLTVAIIIVNTSVTAIFISIVQLKMLGGIPRNKVENILANTNIRNPRLI